MKKMVAMILALVICLGGCATGETEMQSEKTETTIATEMTEEPTTEAPETTEGPTTEATETTEEIEEAADDATVTNRLMHLLEQQNVPTGEHQITAQKYLEQYAMGMYFLLHEELDGYGYLDDQREYLGEYDGYCKGILTWMIAERDPSVNVRRGNGSDPTATAGSAAIDRATFDAYHASLFGGETELFNTDYETPIGMLTLNESEVRMNYYGGLQDALPILKSPRFDPNSGELRIDVLLQWQTTAENGNKYVLFTGDFVSCESPYVCEYPEEYRCATLVFRMEKTNEGYQIRSLRYENLNEDVQTIIPESNPYMYKTMSELLEMIPADTQLQDNMKIGMQFNLLSEYEMGTLLTMTSAGSYEPDFVDGKDYLKTVQEKVKFAWFQMVNGEKVDSANVLWDESANGYRETGAAAVTAEDFSRCYRELYGEEIDLESIDDMLLYESHHITLRDGLVYGYFPTGWQPNQFFKDPSIAYDAQSEVYTLSIKVVGGMTSDIHYEWYDVIEYPSEAVIGTIHYRLSKTENGLRFYSITFESAC